MRTQNIIMLCLLSSFSFAQEKITKTSQSIKVAKDAIIELNTNNVQIEIDTWSRDIVEIEAYIESSSLSQEELNEAVQGWDLEINGSNDNISIQSGRSHGLRFFGERDFSKELKELELDLADMPELPGLHFKVPDFPDIPELPEFPELPELPKGIKSIQFDYEKYQEEGQKYLKEWSKRYEKKGGKELQKRMEAWAKEFAESGYQEKMAKWGEKFGEQYAEKIAAWGETYNKEFGNEWAKGLEAWGEQFAEHMEKQKLKTKHREKTLRNRAEMLKEREQQIKKRASALEKRQEATEQRFLLKGKRSDLDKSKIKRVIKIKIPKKAQLKTNIRHGELKIVSAINNIEAKLSYSFLIADRINGTNTSINASYSPLVIDHWQGGNLDLKFVNRAQIKVANDIIVNSKSSNIYIGELKNSAIIDGSFDEFTIAKLSDAFSNLNLVIEHSDVLIDLPKAADYAIYFKGNRSKLNNQSVTHKTIKSNESQNEKTNTQNIIVNAKYSNVIIN